MPIAGIAASPAAISSSFVVAEVSAAVAARSSPVASATSSGAAKPLWFGLFRRALLQAVLNFGNAAADPAHSPGQLLDRLQGRVIALPELFGDFGGNRNRLGGRARSRSIISRSNCASIAGGGAAPQPAAGGMWRQLSRQASRVPRQECDGAGGQGRRWADCGRHRKKRFRRDR